jgi:predicted metal-binding membrane protein
VSVAGLTGRSLARQERLILLATAALICGLLWWLLAAGPAVHATMHAGTAAQLLHGFLMWLLMMIAMMLPPVLPWIWFFAAATKATPSAGVSWGHTLAFGFGYFSLWGLFSLLAATAQLGLRDWGSHGPTGLLLAPALSAGVLCVAGLYQFSPLKSACLRHCRSPLSYFLSHWKEGSGGAFQLGLAHGLVCLGCCWALMALAFALGTMNLLWMGLITLLLCGEKIAPGGEILSKLAGTGLLIWGCTLLWKAI